jgi:hypothetical protein
MCSFNSFKENDFFAKVPESYAELCSKLSSCDSEDNYYLQTGKDLAKAISKIINRGRSIIPSVAEKLRQNNYYDAVDGDFLTEILTGKKQ